MKVERPGPIPGQKPRITEIWAWTALDPMTDNEGIIAANGLPLVTTVRAQADRLKPIVDGLIAAAEDPKPVAQLRRFVPAKEE
jgi:hypothetical protein